MSNMNSTYLYVTIYHLLAILLMAIFRMIFDAIYVLIAFLTTWHRTGKWFLVGSTSITTGS